MYIPCIGVSVLQHSGLWLPGILFKKHLQCWRRRWRRRGFLGCLPRHGFSTRTITTTAVATTTTYLDCPPSLVLFLPREILVVTTTQCCVQGQQHAEQDDHKGKPRWVDRMMFHDRKFMIGYYVGSFLVACNFCFWCVGDWWCTSLCVLYNCIKIQKWCSHFWFPTRCLIRCFKLGFRKNDPFELSILPDIPDQIRNHAFDYSKNYYV